MSAPIRRFHLLEPAEQIRAAREFEGMTAYWVTELRPTTGAES